MSGKVEAMTDSPESEHAATTSVYDDAVTPDAPSIRSRSRWTRVLPWVIAILALAAAVYSTVQWRALAGYQDQVSSARTAAVGFVDDLTNWDASDGLDDEIESLRAQGTGPFLDEIDLVFGGDDLAGQLEADGISAQGEVEEAFVQELEDGRAEVFTVVSVTYRSSQTQSPPNPVTFPALLELERGDDDGWLIRRVTVPSSAQIGQLMTPSTGG